MITPRWRTAALPVPVAAALLVAGAVALAGCSGSPHAPSNHSTSGNAASGNRPDAGGAVATRWWADPASGVGSTIDPKNPQAEAKKLHPSRQAYCQMLTETVSAGHSILSGSSATSPALRTSTEAFIAELQSVAPAEVSSAWKVLGASVLALVESAGTSAGTPSSQGQLAAAVTTVANDAKTRCGVNLAG